MSVQTVFNLKDPTQGIARAMAAGIRGNIFLSENAMLSFVRFEPESASPIHSHPEEQWTLVLEGECIRILEGVETQVQAGDFWFFPANSAHAVRTTSSSALLLDIFSPPRPEYRAPGQGFGSAK